MTKRISRSLHRLKENKNDWDDLIPEQMSRSQKIAKKTRGLVTAANSITIFGTVLVMNGLLDFANGRKAEGTVKVVGGRVLDLVDGKVADYTGTKGKFGRGLDGGVDFVQLATALPLLVISDVLPIAAATAIAVPKIVDGAATISATIRKKEINPTDEGKKSIFAIWGGIGAFMLHSTIGKHAPDFVDTALQVTGWGGTVGGAIAHIPATIEYTNIGFGSDDILPQQ